MYRSIVILEYKRVLSMPKHVLYRWQQILIENFNVVSMVDISLQDGKLSGPVYADTAPHHDTSCTSGP